MTCTRFSRAARLLLAAGVLLGLLRCSSDVAGGNSSDTGNVCVIVSNGGITVTAREPFLVGVYGTDYRPIPQRPLGFAMIDTCDSAGALRIDSLPADTYNVLIRSLGRDAALFVAAVPVIAGQHLERTFDSLRTPGSIAGIATSRQGSDTLTWMYVYLEGSPFYDYTGATGAFALSDVPPGSYQLSFFGTSAALCPQPPCPMTVIPGESDTVTVSAGLTTVFGRTP